MCKERGYREKKLDSLAGWGNLEKASFVTLKLGIKEFGTARSPMP